MITLNFQIPRLPKNSSRLTTWLILIVLSAISIYCFIHFYQNGLGLSYNDARSHLDIGRRVVEGLKPGLAQLGSVWLPLTHLLMVPTIWNDFFWHTGLSGSIQSMISYVVTGLLIYKFLEKLKVSLFARLVGVFVFATNLNILYLQSTAMTELPLLATMTAGCYKLLNWSQTDNILDLVKAAFWIMLSTLIRYDGWFLLLFATALVALRTWRRKGYQNAEGITILFCTMGGIGIALWFLWNQLIFKDALYFAFGPFSAHSQQSYLEAAGVLASKLNLGLSLKIYLHALMYNSYAPLAVLSLFGAIALMFSKRLSPATRLATTSLLAPLLFNILALYLGFSVLFVTGISGNTWFNVRYGVMLMPSIAIFIGFLFDRIKNLRWVALGLVLFVSLFSFTSQDSVTIDDARFGSSQKNVSEVSQYLADYTKNSDEFILISVASHDAIIFSSGLPMKRFIHEGTGAYWESATTNPDRWARWIIMRTHDETDLTWKFVSKSKGLLKYKMVGHYPFADIYELDPQYLELLNTKAVFNNSN